MNAFVWASATNMQGNFGKKQAQSLIWRRAWMEGKNQGRM
jgi:hypothetical protein